MATWILRLTPGDGAIRLAVKDAIDVAGVPTTVGCAAIADDAAPADTDAPCVATARTAGAAIVGKTNLHELCFGTAGSNPWFGDPVNPLDPGLAPGGSSSGSAVAVALDEADVGLGTDTGGSIRIPAACCGIVGLKTTWGRVSLDGVWPLAPTLDTVGPMARHVAGVTAGMALLEPGFTAAPRPAASIGRVRVPGVDPGIDADVDQALRDAGLSVTDVDLPEMAATGNAFTVLILSEAWASDGQLLARRPDRVGEQVRTRLEQARSYGPDLVPDAMATRAKWQDALRLLFTRFEVLALPTLLADPPPVGAEGVANALVYPWNVAGVPALALPVGRRRPVPASIQLVGPWGAEELLCATAAVIEAAARP